MSAEMLNFMLALLIVVLAFSAWLLRNEFNTGKNKEDIKVLYGIKADQQMMDSLKERLTRLEEKHEGLDNKIMDKLSSIERALARIQGQLNINEPHSEA